MTLISWIPRRGSSGTGCSRVVSGLAHRTKEGPDFRLWSFAYICQFELGRVPRVVEEAVDSRIGPMVAEYMRNMRAAREGGA